MKILCVDDEPLALEDTLTICKELSAEISAAGFTKPAEALDWLRANPADIALLDIDMPLVNGITLAEQIKQIRPDIAIIFLTAYKQFAFDAYSVHPTGYLLKPVLSETLKKELDYACSVQQKPSAPHIEARTFGSFELFVNGKPVLFRRSKSKELLAYLIDRRGISVTRAQISAVLFEDAPYDHSRQKYLDAIIRSLRDTLREYGIEEFLHMERTGLRILPEAVECDMYRFYEGDPETIKSFRGEYLDAYAWTTLAEANMRAIWEKAMQSSK